MRLNAKGRRNFKERLIDGSIYRRSVPALPSSRGKAVLKRQRLLQSLVCGRETGCSPGTARAGAAETFELRRSASREAETEKDVRCSGETIPPVFQTCLEVKRSYWQSTLATSGKKAR